jgi:hypothetical protein
MPSLKNLKLLPLCRCLRSSILSTPVLGRKAALQYLYAQKRQFELLSSSLDATLLTIAVCAHRPVQTFTFLGFAFLVGRKASFLAACRFEIAD